MTDTNAGPAVPQRDPGTERDVRESPTPAFRTRATVAHMGNDDWFDKPAENNGTPPWHQMGPAAPMTAPQPPPQPAISPAAQGRRRRVWPYLAAIVVLGLAVVGVRQHTADEEKATAYKGVSAVDLRLDGVKVETLASWSDDGRSVALSARVDPDEEPKLVRIGSGHHTATEKTQPLKSGQIPMPINLKVSVPVKDRYQAVQLTVAVGGPHWRPGSQTAHRTVEFHPDRTAIDTETGERLKQSYSHLL